MPICTKCKQRIPNRIKIDGKMRILSSRKYCLDCSPFRGNNRRTLEKFPDNFTKEKCVCSSCNREYRWKRVGGGTLQTCCSCITRRHRYRVRKKAANYLGGKCSICGYNKCLRALDFHHLDPEAKNFSLASAMGNQNWEKIKKELDKCILLCANCHRETEDKDDEIMVSIV